VISGRRLAAGALVALLCVPVAACGEGGAPEASGPLPGVRPIKYGGATSQIGELTLPNELGPHPVVVLIHGGWWRTQDFDRRHMRDVADDLSDHGYAVWNLEFRLVGEEGGGWPGTFEDVASGIDHLATLGPENNLDLASVVVVGHSSGGQLALWAAARPELPQGTPGADPQVDVAAVVALAPLADLFTAAQQNLGDGAVQALLGGSPQEVTGVYETTSPNRLLPFDPPVLLVHGTADRKVPVEQTLGLASSAQAAGDSFELMVLDDVNHFELIDTESRAWTDTRDEIDDLLDAARRNAEDADDADDAPDG
jgi:acetyl esterase/lipase